MTALYLAGVWSVLVLPKEFHIDCSGWHGKAAVQIQFQFRPVKGKGVSNVIEMQPDTTPKHVRDGIETYIEDFEWRSRRVGNNILVIEGSKDSPIASVQFQSKDWKPDVRMVILVPKKK